MTRVRIVLAIAAFMCSACGTGSGAVPDAPTVEPTILEVMARDSNSTANPPEPLTPTAVSTIPAEFRPLDGCRLASADRLDIVVTFVIDHLAGTTSEDGWSRACARVDAPDSSEEPYFVTVKVGWMGTLHDYASTPGARPIAGLADEAYTFDGGHQIALRSGELVAVVSHSGGPASGTEAWARQVADQLPE